MFGKSKRSVALLAGAAGFNLLLGMAVASGVVPQASSVSVTSEDSAAAAIVVPETAEVNASASTSETTVADAPPETAPPTTAPATTTPTIKASPKPAAQEEAGAAPVQAGAETPAPTTAATSAPAAAQSTAVPRLNPPSFQVFQAIQHLSLRIPLFRPTEAQARQFGDMVCTAFDQGKSYAEVRTGVMSAVSQVPGLSVSAADADYAIRTAVGLFCPGHNSKLA